LYQIKQAEKRLGRVAVLKEQELGSTSDGTSDGAVEEEDDEANLGPKSHISLLDQHSDLKRKAEGLCQHPMYFPCFIVSP